MFTDFEVLILSLDSSTVSTTNVKIENGFGNKHDNFKYKNYILSPWFLKSTDLHTAAGTKKMKIYG